MPAGLNPSAVYPDNLLVEPGNIDLTKRKVVHNPDGTISTEQSIGIGTDKGEAIIPTIDPTGHKMDQQTAIDLYQVSGQHMGIYKTPQAADVAATKIHEDQQARYMDPVSRDFYLQQKTFEQAAQSGKDQETNFVIGQAKGLAIGTGGILGDALDFIQNHILYKGPDNYDPNAVPFGEQARKFLTEKLLPAPKPGEAAGSNFGEVTSNFIDPLSKPLAAVAGLTKAGLFAGLASRSTKFSGEMAKAKALLEAGVSPMEVWKTTGFFNVNQGIKDAPIEIARHLDISQMSIPLDHVREMQKHDVPVMEALSNIDHVFAPDEYKPLFDNYKIAFEKMPPDTYGYHDVKNMRLVLNTSLIDKQTGLLSEKGYGTIAHEMEHAIQTYEGWIGSGSNPSGLAKKIYDRIGRGMIDKVLRGQVNTYNKVLNTFDNHFRDSLHQLKLIQYDQDVQVAVVKEQKAILEAAKRDPRIPAQDLSAMQENINKEHDILYNILREKKKFIDDTNAVLKHKTPTEKEVKRLRARGIDLPEWMVKGDVGLSTAWPDERNVPTMRHIDPTNDTIHRIYEHDVGEAWARAADRTRRMTDAEMAASAPWRFLDVSPQNMTSKYPGIGEYPPNP